MTINSSSSKYNTIVACSIIGVLILGAFLTIRITKIEKADIQSGLLLRAENAALLIDHEKVMALDANNSDIYKQEYNELKATLVDMVKINTDARFVYIMGYSGGQNMFFYVDSEDPNSDDYSPPGQIFNDVQDGELTNYREGRSYILEPYEDDWGVWMSAMAPIIHPETGETVALVGLDIDAHEYKSDIGYVRWTLIIITLLIEALIIALGAALMKSGKRFFALQDEHDELKKKHTSIEQKHAMMGVGSFKWAIKSGFVTLDEDLAGMLGVSHDDKMSIEDFKWKMEKMDKENFEALYAAAVSSKENTFSFIMRIKIADGKMLQLDTKCQLERDGAGNPFVLNGVTRKL